jgi:hypothetical protein
MFPGVLLNADQGSGIPDIQAVVMSGRGLPE